MRVTGREDLHYSCNLREAYSALQLAGAGAVLLRRMAPISMTAAAPTRPTNTSTPMTIPMIAPVERRLPEPPLLPPRVLAPPEAVMVVPEGAAAAPVGTVASVTVSLPLAVGSVGLLVGGAEEGGGAPVNAPAVVVPPAAAVVPEGAPPVLVAGPVVAAALVRGIAV